MPANATGQLEAQAVGVLRVQVEIWSDVVCPWCYIGKRRFEEALEQFEHRDDVDVVWRSFELDPEAPRSPSGKPAERSPRSTASAARRPRGRQRRDHRARRRGRPRLRPRPRAAGNTFDAHRLIHLAAEHGLQDRAQGGLMHAYFSEGEAISDRDDAVGARPSRSGSPGRGPRRASRSGRFADAVRGDERARVPDRHPRRAVLRPRPALRRVGRAARRGAARRARAGLGGRAGRRHVARAGVRLCTQCGWTVGVAEQVVERRRRQR